MKEEMRIRWIPDDEGMPFDRYDPEVGFIHATGREYYDPFPGCWSVEYEDSITVGMPTTE